MLVVLDGFGLGDGGPGDATAQAHAPFLARAQRLFPHAQLETSGESVGLPPGQMGNSEVGHMTMGAGRIRYQDMTRISKTFEEIGPEHVPAIARALDVAARGRGRLHLLGLVSDGGVHSHEDHLIALLAACKRSGVQPVLHAFLDGRDTPPRSGHAYLARVLPHVSAADGCVATVIGRYWAMDRDNRWDRVGRAYHAIVCREGIAAKDALAAVEAAYGRDEGDEFVQPTVIEGGFALEDGDAALFFNFRADRAREITNALTSARPGRFEGRLDRKRVVRPGIFVCLTEYDAEFGLPVAFAPSMPKHILGEILSAARLPQLRMAETEKYAHVTFFFNNGREEPFEGEDRVLVPSPRDVATYDHKPEMSAEPLTSALLEKLDERDYAFILVNFANPDMVGHTGVLPAAVKAVETIDRCLDRITEKVLALGGQALITADHGNCESMIDPQTGGPHTAHTTNPVPIYWITRDAAGRRLRNGGLADLAPTVLALLGIPVPAEMTGSTLIVSG
ncbi:MAG: phosphoglycerate mutase (2,3-diphosphoglycerate-independent) [Deltaproteobacteria bacterium]|nr:phosphoglycerate mutase (2,3-diphosphoglycerate-independent) [Deltaproteobacteria bacterium]